eukprot:scaffold1313_cov406-Prasinococcus_capsulatus_cf.AAC.4
MLKGLTTDAQDEDNVREGLDYPEEEDERDDGYLDSDDELDGYERQEYAYGDMIDDEVDYY